MNLLRETIRRLILEALKFDELNKAILLKCEDRGKLYYLLLKSEIVEVVDTLFSMLYKITDEDDWGRYTKSDLLVDELIPEYSHLVLAMAQVKIEKGPLDSTEVKMSAANEGWGPTLYDIIMGETDGIIPDRESVSQGAYDVYNYYHQRRKDIEKIPLDSKHHKWTPDPSDDADWGSRGRYSEPSYKNTSDKSITQKQFNDDPLNWVYNRGPVSQTQQAYRNAEKLFDVFEKWGDIDTDEVLEYFTEKLAPRFFHSKYKRD